MSEQTYIVNFDGLVGSTHNYAGLAFGNLASRFNAKNPSNPKLAALQGLQKMYQLMKLGVKQAILPPHQRPNLDLLKQLGFCGSVETILKQAYETAPEIFLASVSGSSMWAANSATVSPSSDTMDHKVHITPANLTTHLQRHIETDFTEKVFQRIFSNQAYFTIHKPLLSAPLLADEGSANHLHFCMPNNPAPGIEVFVYGENKSNPASPKPKRFPARQTLTASRTLARLHQLQPDRTIFVQQNPNAIDAGVFHNDVIAVANENVFLYHEAAFLAEQNLEDQLEQHFQTDFYPIKITCAQLTLQELVRTYLFNSQIVTIAPQEMVLIAPEVCQTDPKAYAVIQQILADPNPIQSVRFVDCSQSLQNGGGPACLRLPVRLTQSEYNTLPSELLLTEYLYSKLIDWVEKHYRDTLSEKDLCDSKLMTESFQALDELTQILDLGSIYPFQSV